MKKRVISALLSILLLLTLFPVSAFAATEVASGYCGGEGDGTNLTWTLDSEGTLTISGTGRMKNYNYYSPNISPWYNYRNRITSVEVNGEVSNIGEYAFYSCENITSISLSDSVVSLGDWAFIKCSHLKKVNLPEGLKDIGKYTFESCGDLADITIPDTVISIGGRAFSNCSSLTGVTIPASVMSLGARLFEGCQHLSNITVNENSKNYSSDASGVLFDRQKTELLQYPLGRTDLSYSIPSGVTHIRESAFDGCGYLANLSIPGSVISIEQCAFRNCTGLTGIVLPNAVTELGPSAFFGCSSLKSVTLPNRLTDISNGLFSGCSSLAGVAFPSSVTTIGTQAFRGCRSFTSFTVPDTVTGIGHGVFFACDNLTSITLPFLGDGTDTNAYLGYIFGAASYLDNEQFVPASLRTVILSDKCTFVGEGAFYGCGGLADVSVGDHVTDIGSDAFSYCDSLTSVTIGNSVKHIGRYAFDSCTALTKVNINDLASWCGISCEDGGSPLACAKYLYIDGEIATDITIPYGVSRIGENIFCGYDSLTGIKIPDSVTEIGYGAFSGCDGLVSVTIPGSVKVIGSAAFFYCENLTNVAMENGVTEIGDSAFYWCEKLADIAIPASVESVGYRAFDGCGLRDVYYGGSEAQWNDLSSNAGYGNGILFSSTVHFNCNGGLRPSGQYTLDAVSGVRHGVYEYKTNHSLRDAECSFSDKHLNITLDGYEPVDIQNCTLDEKRYQTLTLIPTSVNSHISAVHCSGKDALMNEVKILSTAKPFDIYVYGSGAKYQLFSDYPSLLNGNMLAESTDGHFTVNPASLTKEKQLYVRAVTAGGVVGEAIKTNIRVKDVLSKTPKLSGKTMFTIPDDVPVIGGGKFNFDFSFLPVTLQQDGNSVRLGIGCKEDLLKGEKSTQNWLKWKKFVEKQDKTLQKGLSALMLSSNHPFWEPVTAGADKKLDCSCYGFIEGTFADDGTFSRAAGFFAISLSGSVSQEWQTMVWVIPVVLKAKAEVGFDQVYSIDMDIENAKIYFDGTMTLTLPKIRLSSGVGIAYVGDLSVYGSATNKIELRFAPSYVKATLSGELGVSAKALIWSGEWPLLQGDWEYYHSGRASLMSLQSGVQEKMLEESDYHLDRSYIDTQSGWYTDQPKKMRLMSSGSNDASETTVQSSVYYSADPQLVITDNGTRVMVWTADIPSRSTGNHLAAVYSVYDENSGTWSAPVIVDDDGTLDAHVTAAAYGSKVYMAWSDAKSSDFTAETTMADMAAALEISAAVYDTETGNISVSRLTDNDLADLRPMLSADKNGIYAAWVENSSADLLQMSGTNSIRYSAFDGGAWSEPATFASIDKPIVGLNIGTLGESVNIAYTADTDGDLATTEDVELYCGAVGSSASGLTDNESMEQNPQFVDWLGSPVLAWYGGESICVFDGNSTTTYAVADTGIGADFTVENGRILSVQHSDDGSMLYSSDILDGEIGNPVAITNNADYIASFSAESSGSTTYVAFTRRSAVIGEESITESTDLCIAGIEGFHDLTLRSAEVDEADVSAGATVPVTLTVKNNGLFDESSVLVTGTLDGAEKVSVICDTPIAKGDTVAITVQLPLENAIEPKTEYVFSVAPVDAEDRNAEDNESSLILGYADLQLNAELIGSGENKIALIDVENLSGIDTNAILHIYDDDDERTQLAAYDIGTIEAGTWELYEIDSSLLPQLRETNRNLYFTVEAAEEEALSGDNSAFLYLQSEERELTITVSVNGEEIDFRCGASGISQIAVAIYNEAGKMISVKTVDYSEGCEEVTVTFTDTAIPQSCHVKAFLLNKSWTPVTAVLVSVLTAP